MQNDDMASNGPQWSVAVNSDPGCAVRQNRRLYEALLRLEQEGCAVVDRAMAHPADLVLSASACAAVWTEDALKARTLHAPDLAPGSPYHALACMYTRCK